MPLATHTLETVALLKEYPGTVALRDVSLRFDGGRIHALLGKNGAGKSTLVKILAGAVQPTAGSILINGNAALLRSPREALTHGIAAVHQELSIIPGLSVAENIFLGRLPKRPSRLIDWPATHRQAEAILLDLGVEIDVREEAGRFGVARQQMIEIAKAMSYAPSVLMLDEPTSALARHETELLFALLRTLAARGVVLLYITHRLEEIHKIADTVTVLRDGELVGTVDIDDATPSKIVQMMFGETVQSRRQAETPVRQEKVLEVRDFSRRGAFEKITFTVHTGEILGIAGLLGSGRTELLRALFGADAHDSGSLVICGGSVSPSSPGQMKRLGMALAPENRKEEGLIQMLSTRINIVLSSLGQGSRMGVASAGRERAIAASFLRELNIAASSVDTSVASLSGGNQQKVVIAKWLNTQPRIILLDEPTRGIDIQAKGQMFQIIRDLSAKGISSVVVSSELEELMEVCHRILIMKKGRIVGEMDPHTSTLEHLFSVCME